MARANAATVREIIKRVFPAGTGDEETASWKRCPAWPPDLFAVTAFLLERSGLYAYLSPGERHFWGQPWFYVDPYMKQQWVTAAEEWKADPPVPAAVETLWSELYAASENAIFTEPLDSNAATPIWVIKAFALMYISDQACGEVGYLHPDDDNGTASWIALFQLKVEAEIYRRTREAELARDPNAIHFPVKYQQLSITKKATTDLVAVQPKAHTAQVGLTLRAISLNLALLPPPSRMSATWNRIAAKIPDDDLHAKSLDILLVPLPYKIEKEDVAGHHNGDPSQPWGWFEIKQNWLPAADADANGHTSLGDFVSALIQQAESTGDRKSVDVVVFPELALSWRHYKHLVGFLASKHPEIEFVVAGSSTNHDGETGNFTLTSTITHTDDKTFVHTTSRGKHHRWRLERSQIENYDLEMQLQPQMMWWEKIAVARRMVHTHVFRNNSCFTTFICEDLARSDPAHETVRALGPSVVFSILMDGPQLASRWSARYALGLVEDPGSAVLTFTSRGLMQRTRDRELRRAVGDAALKRVRGEAYPRRQNWSVALWKDSDNGPIELHCPPPDHGILLSLQSRQLADHSYDGRISDEGVSWHFRDVTCVRLPDGHSALKLMPGL